MKFRPALLFCLLLVLGFPSIGLSAWGINIPITGSPVPSTYRGRAGKYTVVATFQTNGTISALVYNNSIIVPSDERITGVGTNTTNGLVYIGLGQSGYLEGRAHRRGMKIIARLVLQNGDKVIKRRCVLKWVEPAHGVVITYTLPQPVSTPPPAGTTNFSGLTREEAEAIIELARRRLQQNNPAPPILSPGVRNSF
jgi:hypothetical protein